MFCFVATDAVGARERWGRWCGARSTAPSNRRLSTPTIHQRHRRRLANGLAENAPLEAGARGSAPVRGASSRDGEARAHAVADPRSSKLVTGRGARAESRATRWSPPAAWRTRRSSRPPSTATTELGPHHDGARQVPGAYRPGKSRSPSRGAPGRAGKLKKVCVWSGFRRSWNGRNTTSRSTWARPRRDRVWTCDLSESYVRRTPSTRRSSPSARRASSVGPPTGPGGAAEGNRRRKSVAALTRRAARGRSALRPSDQRWNPKMQKYIFASATGHYIIDLQKTLKKFGGVRFGRDAPAGHGSIAPRSRPTSGTSECF